MKKTITDYCEKVHFGFTYQSMDFGTVGYNDGNLEFNQVIVNNPYQIIEVVDKGGNKVENNEIGELIVTNLSRKLIPIIRFKTGDLVRFDGNKLLTILGRLSNIPKIGGEKFQLDVINEYLEDNRSFTGRYQYILSKRENIDHILLKLELVDHIADSEEVKLELKRIFFEQFPKLDKQIKNKAVHDIELEFAVEKEIGFILSKGTGKIRNLVDRRQEYEI